MVNIPVWSELCQRKMLNPKMNKKKLAEILKVNYTSLCCVMSGQVVNDNIRKAICKYFEVE